MFKVPQLFRMKNETPARLFFTACLFMALSIPCASLIGGEPSFIPFGLGRNLEELKKQYGDPVSKPAGFLPPSPTFKKGDYYFAFGFKGPERPAELIFIYRTDGADFSKNELNKLLQKNKATTRSDWAPCERIPNQALNMLGKNSYQSTGSDHRWAVHIVSQRSPPTFQPALVIMSDDFLQMMSRDANN